MSDGFDEAAAKARGKKSAALSVDSGMDEQTAYIYGWFHGEREQHEQSRLREGRLKIMLEEAWKIGCKSDQERDAALAEVERLRALPTMQQLELREQRENELKRELAEAKTVMASATKFVVPGETDHPDAYLKLLTAERDKSAKLAEATEALIKWMKVIHENPSYIGVWQVAQLHVGPYTGPKYDKEFERVQAALAEYLKDEK